LTFDTDTIRVRVLFPVLALLIFPLTCFAGRKYEWDSPAPVKPDTVLFGEEAVPEEPAPELPKPGDKSYPWYYLDKGNDHVLAGEYDRAVVSYQKVYSVPGPTRVLSGFKLVETLQTMKHFDAALKVLDEMEKKYLVSAREAGEAKRVRMDVLDARRSGAVEIKAPRSTGRDWLRQLSVPRVKYVLQGMDILHARGVPLKESYQGYVFLLDEYFSVHPEADASDPAETLAVLVYERDKSSRLPIDRWRADPNKAPVPKPDAMEGRLQKITGAEWITLVQDDKLAYVAGAMNTLRNQRVPMKRSLHAYTSELDRMFTRKPELPACDSVVALASFLYKTEPEARQVLEALRLK